MLSKEKKESIIKSYLEALSIKVVMQKHNISKPTVYRLLEEFSIPKISEIRRKNQAIIDYYINNPDSNKESVIREIARKFEVTVKYILNLFKKYHIPIPIIINPRLRPIDLNPINDENISYIENDESIDSNSEIYESVSIISKFKELGWDKRDASHRLLNLAHYLKVKNGIDIFEKFSQYLEQTIKNQETAELKYDIETIERGETLNIGNIENRINYLLLKQVEEMVFELSEPELLESDKNYQSNFETKKYAEKSLINPQFLMILFNPRIPKNLKINMIYIKMFEIVSKMEIKVIPQQINDFIDKINHSRKIVDSLLVWKEKNEEKA
ncbi:hypothetical protein LCGC14_1800900 [marine sediment metagenome]|uniref:Uncharacterized protein n=1 Tax=marine sediment metagenome TaxID=412755 RepID=A0A0F9HCF6_9ZZZZ